MLDYVGQVVRLVEFYGRKGCSFGDIAAALGITDQVALKAIVGAAIDSGIVAVVNNRLYPNAVRTPTGIYPIHRS